MVILILQLKVSINKLFRASNLKIMIISLKKNEFYLFNIN